MSVSGNLPYIVNKFKNCQLSISMLAVLGLLKLNPFDDNKEL